MIGIPSYEASFRAFSNRVILDRPLAGNPVDDARAVLGAIRKGSVFTAIDALAGPALLAVTNDSHNRLRHPLLKNVMAARMLQFALLGHGVAEGEHPISLGAIRAFAPAPRDGACRMLTGALAEQAEALAQVLASCGEAR